MTIYFPTLQKIEHKEEEDRNYSPKVLKKNFKFSLKGITLENRILQFQKTLNAPLVRKNIKIDLIFFQIKKKYVSITLKSLINQIQELKGYRLQGPKREFYNKIELILRQSKDGQLQ